MFICIEFKWALIINSVLRVLEKCFRKLDLIKRHTVIITCSTFESGCDKINLISYWKYETFIVNKKLELLI